MFTVNIKVKNKDPKAYEKLKKRLLAMSSKKVVAGFPKGKLNNPHYEGSKGHPGASIIDVAIWNEFGTYNIPRRDFLNPASAKWQEYFKQMVEENQEEIVTGKLKIDNFLKTMGEAGAEFIRSSIIKLDTPPNAPITIEGGWMKNKKSGKPFKVKGKKSSNPLVDTGDLSKAPTYEIRRKDA